MGLCSSVYYLGNVLHKIPCGCSKKLITAVFLYFWNMNLDRDLLFPPSEQAKRVYKKDLRSTG
jgi:hypothetical protein